MVVDARRRRSRRPGRSDATTPRKSQTISDSVQRRHDGARDEEAPEQPSVARVIFASLIALRAMIAMTAAPTP